MRFSLTLSFVFSVLTLLAANDDSLNILFIGNSFTHMNAMPKIFEKLCKDKNKPVHVQMNTQAGASFQVHSTREDMFAAIRSRKWDFVILQGYSREFAMPYDKIDVESLPYLTKIVDSINLYSPCANKLFYLTWGYKFGYKEMTSIDSYDKMAEAIIKGYRYISSCYDFPIVPVGIVWKNVRTKHPEINLYVEDDAHPNKYGSYLAACTFYTAIFRESVEGAITSTIDAQTAEILQKEASDYVLSNLHDLNLDRNYFDILPERTNTGKYKLTLKAEFSNAAKYFWDLGNGVKKEGKELVYFYKKQGKYKVQLTVKDDCGIRNFSKVIKYESPKKPTKYSNSSPKRATNTKRKN